MRKEIEELRIISKVLAWAMGEMKKISPACVYGKMKASQEQQGRYRKPNQLLSFVSKTLEDHSWNEAWHCFR